MELRWKQDPPKEIGAGYFIRSEPVLQYRAELKDYPEWIDVPTFMNFSQSEEHRKET